MVLISPLLKVLRNLERCWSLKDFLKTLSISSEGEMFSHHVIQQAENNPHFILAGIVYVQIIM